MRLLETSIKVNVSEVDGVEDLVMVDFVIDLDMIFSVRRVADEDGDVAIVTLCGQDVVVYTSFDAVVEAWKEYLGGLRWLISSN